MKAYKLLHGKHRVLGTDGEPDQTYVKGDVIRTDADLTKFNSPGSMRFQVLTDAEEVAEAAKRGSKADRPKEAESDEPDAKNTQARANRLTREELEAMTVPDLRGYAEEEEIDLGDVTRKADIIDVIFKNLPAGV